MQGINRKADMVSIRISRETRDALSSIKDNGQSYDSIIRHTKLRSKLPRHSNTNITTLK